MTTLTGEIIRRQAEPRQDGWWVGFNIFLKAMRRSPAGMVGFVGLLFYAVFTFVGPLFVPFDTTVRLDQIAAPPGTRYQLLVRADDVDRYRTFDDLAGGTLGYVRDTGGEQLVEPYLDDEASAPFELEDTRWRSGRGVPDAMQTLVDGEVERPDCLVGLGAALP
ncbi:MAG: hypothetical protein HC828_10695 [Blastochloris sp.]|nr:hypothetical protein [Blastochloris sp.]